MKRKHTFIILLRTATLFLVTIFCVQVGYSQQAAKTSSRNLKDTISNSGSKADKNGKLVPRAALTGTTDNITIKGKTTNLLIYNTAKAGPGKTMVYPGYYHNVGTSEQPEWKRVEVSVSNAVQEKK